MNTESKQIEWVKIAQGDSESWREFLGRVTDQLYGMFMRRWPNRSLAEELIQKTVFDALRGRGSYDPQRGSPEQWITGIARNNLALEARKRAARPVFNGDITEYLQAMDTELMPDEILEQTETADLVRSALGKMDTKEQNVLRAKYLEGLSVRDIARKLTMTEKAVHSLLYRARNTLRNKLKSLAPLQKEERQS